jgi:hypothetical protein
MESRDAAATLEEHSEEPVSPALARPRMIRAAAAILELGREEAQCDLRPVPNAIGVLVFDDVPRGRVGSADEAHERRRVTVS